MKETEQLERSRYRGAMLGLAVGDALGTTLEFQRPGTFQPLTNMVGGGPFGLRPGQWTDDTSMALCLAESLVERQGFDAHDQMVRYCRWYRLGYLSSTGKCFDIGMTVRSALERFETTGDPIAGSTDEFSAGNGSLMRLAPIPLAFGRDPNAAIQWAAESSRTTHGAAAAVDACRYYAGLLVGALQGEDKQTLLDALYSPLGDRWMKTPLDSKVVEVASGSFKHKHPPDIRGTGYVVEALEAALWAFHHHDNFEQGCLAAVNLGNDADTTGAIYGQLAGAYYGVEAIPERWRQVIAMRERLEELADALLMLSRSMT